MKQDTRRIVEDDQVLGGKPRIRETRLGVAFVKARVEGAGLTPREFADRHDVDVADVYHALAYYHDNPDRMQEIERGRREAVERHRGESVEPPEKEQGET